MTKPDQSAHIKTESEHSGEYAKTVYDIKRNHLSDESWVNFMLTTRIGFLPTMQEKKTRIQNVLNLRGKSHVSKLELKHLAGARSFKTGLRTLIKEKYGSGEGIKKFGFWHLGKPISIKDTSEEQRQLRECFFASKGTTQLMILTHLILTSNTRIILR
jgi:hypothetical protein